MTWRLRSIRLGRFRGAQGEVSVGPLNQLVCIYGDNGSGKTTVAEALVWLVTGKVPRKEHARSLNLATEVARYIRNVHASSPCGF